MRLLIKSIINIIKYLFKRKTDNLYQLTFETSDFYKFIKATSMTFNKNGLKVYWTDMFLNYTSYYC